MRKAGFRRPFDQPLELSLTPELIPSSVLEESGSRPPLGDPGSPTVRDS